MFVYVLSGPEYGTTEAAWKGVLTESERLSDVHMKIKENLCTDVTTQIKTWQKDNYHKTLMQIKERKDMEDLFKKAQKPWAKLLSKVEKAKSEYHAACKTEKTASNQERNATGDSSLSQDQVSDYCNQILNSVMIGSLYKKKYLYNQLHLGVKKNFIDFCN